MLLTNSNGEYRDGSSNKTPHIVGHIHRPPLVAHTLQLLRANYGLREAGRETARACLLYRWAGGDSRASSATGPFR
jgi:hypothetical protein